MYHTRDLTHIVSLIHKQWYSLGHINVSVLMEKQRLKYIKKSFQGWKVWNGRAIFSTLHIFYFLQYIEQCSFLNK
jgi:hypothetical protein